MVAGIEADYAGHLGAERFAALKELLADLVSHTDPHGGLGTD